ncbi:formyltransferase family protein [Flavobacterium sp.]
MISQLDFVEIVGVCAPLDDKYITKSAHRFNVPVIAAGTLNGDTMPDNVDIGITAHSFDYIGRKTRYKPKIGWIGYHPSLLPRHRGRSAIEWAVRMKDPITGGTVFWLNSGIDRGDVAYQDWIFIDPTLYAMEPKKAAKRLWEYELQAMGLRLLKQALTDIHAGIIIKKPQVKEYSTFEPNADVKDVYKPDLLMLEQFASTSS